MSTQCYENYKVRVERHESAFVTHENLHLSHNIIWSHPLPHHAGSQESGSPYDTKIVYKCNATPPKTKKPNYALPILGTAKLNLWNAIPTVTTRQACTGTKSELKIKHRANEYICKLHVAEECKIRLWHY
jgi:hypothetical protein